MVMGVVGSGYVLSRLAPVSGGVGPGGSSPHLWNAKAGALKRSEAAAESDWIELGLTNFDWFAFFGCWTAWRCWVGWGLHGFRPGIEWEYTWQGQGHGRARRGKAAQGVLEESLYLDMGLGQGLGVRGGEGRGERFPNPFHLQVSLWRHFWVSTLLQIGWLAISA